MFEIFFLAAAMILVVLLMIFVRVFLNVKAYREWKRTPQSPKSQHTEGEGGLTKNASEG
ncbi:MAG TPA: hypothetical protein VFE96_08250 [Candidatus Bathyarchaeia archaeon]|nr:hypothetical protein [Candidatus Bathyarchaeia archaeon]